MHRHHTQSSHVPVCIDIKVALKLILPFVSTMLLIKYTTDWKNVHKSIRPANSSWRRSHLFCLVVYCQSLIKIKHTHISARHFNHYRITLLCMCTLTTPSWYFTHLSPFDGTWSTNDTCMCVLIKASARVYHSFISAPDKLPLLRKK